MILLLIQGKCRPFLSRKDTKGSNHSLSHDSSAMKEKDDSSRCNNNQKVSRDHERREMGDCPAEPIFCWCCVLVFQLSSFQQPKAFIFLVEQRCSHTARRDDCRRISCCRATQDLVVTLSRLSELFVIFFLPVGRKQTGKTQTLNNYLSP